MNFINCANKVENTIKFKIGKKNMKITYKLIAKHIHKTEAGIKYLAKTDPDLLEIIKLGLIQKLKQTL